MCTILITGGTGYIGSHMVVKLLERNYHCVIVDNLSNSYENVLEKIKKITDKSHLLQFHKVDITDQEALDSIMRQYTFSACIHFAGVKAVGGSVQNPMKYYQNNVTGSYVLIDLLRKHNCKNIIFSSSSTVYGNTNSGNILETDPLKPVNPYGRTKRIVEGMLEDINKSEPNKWNIDILRYFNPVGAHKSGLLKENPVGTPKNLFPFVAQVYKGEKKRVHIFGNTYLTKDGTGVRDYIHVMDLIEGHFVCLENMLKRRENKEPTLIRTYNLGTGIGTSVLEVINLFQMIGQKKIPHSFASIRSGDVACSVCNTDKIYYELGWLAKNSVNDAIRDLLRE